PGEGEARQGGAGHPPAAPQIHAPKLPGPNGTTMAGTRITARGGCVTVQAYVLIQTEVGKAAQVASEVRKIDGVRSADDVTGPYDVIVSAEADTVDDLGKMVVCRVR